MMNERPGHAAAPIGAPRTAPEAVRAIANHVAIILHALAAIRHLALSHNLPLHVPASQPYSDLLGQMARLRHPTPAEPGGTPDGAQPHS